MTVKRVGKILSPEELALLIELGGRDEVDFTASGLTSTLLKEGDKYELRPHFSLSREYVLRRLREGNITARLLE